MHPADARTARRRDRTVTFSVGLEVGADRWCTAWVAELPGCFTNASSERAALRALPEAVTGFLRWLEEHGELPDPPEQITAAVTERHRVRARLRWGGYYALHDFERPPVSPEEVSRAMRRMGLLRADTVRLVESLPRGALHWTRPGQARTIRQHLEHIAAAERWYLQRLRLGPFPALGRARNPLDRLARVRSLVGWRLLHLTPEERTRITKTDHEWWSARKMLGRFLYHERYHIRAIARIARFHKAPVPAGLGGWARYG